MHTTFIKIEHRLLNISAIKAIKIYDEGGIRIFSDVPNAETPGTFYYYDVDDAEMAQKVLDALSQLAIQI